MEARIVEARGDELRFMDHLCIEAGCQRSPIIVNTSKSRVKVRKAVTSEWKERVTTPFVKREAGSNQEDIGR